MSNPEQTPEQLARIGESVFFIAQCGGPDRVEHLMKDPAGRIATWWNGRSHGEQIYRVQYGKPVAGMEYIVFPEWAKLRPTGKAEFQKKVIAAIERATRTLV